MREITNFYLFYGFAGGIVLMICGFIFSDFREKTPVQSYCVDFNYGIFIKIYKKMNEDNLLLLISFIIFFLSLFILLKKTKNKKSTLIINLIIHFIYSFYLLYGLLYDSEGGSGLAWWFFLLISLWLHSIINFGQFFYIF
ncbi:MAG: hypothetical protein ACKOXV_03370, partial [Bacteroidota bacterium]